MQVSSKRTDENISSSSSSTCSSVCFAICLDYLVASDQLGFLGYCPLGFYIYFRTFFEKSTPILMSSER